MRPKRLGSFLIIGLLIAAAIPVVCIVVSARDSDNEFEEYDVDKIAEKGKPSGGGGSTTPITYSAPNDKSHLAVIIGIADYKYANDLQYTDDDAKDMYDYLIAQSYSSGSIVMLIDSGASANGIMSAIDWLDQYETQSSEVFFYYSGHGTYVRDSSKDESDKRDECIVSYDSYAITDDTLKKEFSSFSSTKIGIVFDSCYSGGMGDLKASNRVVITACAEKELSYDGDTTMKNGVFTWYFLKELNTYDTLEEAYSYSYDSVHNWGTDNNIQFHPQIFDQYTNDWDFTL